MHVARVNIDNKQLSILMVAKYYTISSLRGKLLRAIIVNGNIYRGTKTESKYLLPLYGSSDTTVWRTIYMCSISLAQIALHVSVEYLHQIEWTCGCRSPRRRIVTTTTKMGGGKRVTLSCRQILPFQLAALQTHPSTEQWPGVLFIRGSSESRLSVVILLCHDWGRRSRINVEV